MKKKITGEPTQHPYLRRFLAFLVDWYISSFIALIPTLVFQSINGKDLVLVNRIDTLNSYQALAATILALLVYTWYYCIFPLHPHGGTITGQTLGRRLFNITLVKTDGSPLAFKDLFLRNFVGVLLLQGNITSINIYLMALVEKLSGSVAFIPYLQSLYYLLLALSLFLVFTKRKQTFHDLMSRTRVILASAESKPHSLKAGSRPAS